MSAPEDPQTLLSAFHFFTEAEKLPTEPPHPFSTSAEQSLASLRELLNTIETVNHSTNLHLAGPSLNSKTVSLLRQEAAGHDLLHLTSQHVRQTISAVRERSSILYGTDVPLSKDAIPDWCISRISEWGKQVGMEAFLEAGRDGRKTLALAGKVLVLDVDFIVQPTVDVMTLKTSYAVTNGASSDNSGSAFSSLDGYLVDMLRDWLKSVQSDDVSGIPTAKLGRRVLESLRYLMTLEQLASKEGERGVRWFNHEHELGNKLEGFAKTEAQVVAHEHGLKEAPLDILLLRGHALPLPYLTSPSLSFLVHLSPLPYLSLLRSTPPSPLASPPTTPSSSLPSLSIPFPHLRASLPSISQSLPGTTLATLRLSPLISSTRPNPSTNDSDIELELLASPTRPTFPLAPAAAGFTHSFPIPEQGGWVWLLDFTGQNELVRSATGQSIGQPGFGSVAGKKGVIMSQSRIREVEGVVNPLSDMIENLGDGAGGMHMNMMGYGGSPSWIDMLLNPDYQGYSQNYMKVERYTATYTSPTGLHPPLQLRLDVPDEPGFLLEQVQVYTMKEVTAILEIVKEQCWLNSMLESCKWTPESPDGPSPMTDPMEASTDNEQSANEDDELRALLDGTFTPYKIPVSLSLPSTPSSPQIPLADPLQSSSSLFSSLPRNSSANHPRLTMSFPERPPMSGLIDVEIRYEPGRKRGVGVDVRGAMGVDWEGEVGEELEEAVRRGGGLGVPGRVWERAGKMGGP